MLSDSTVSLEVGGWSIGTVPWTHELSGEHGVVVSSILPEDEGQAKLVLNVWKTQLRLWWSAWTCGHKVLELRSWWRTGRAFHVWCVSRSTVPLQLLSLEQVKADENCAKIVSHIHRDFKLNHGMLGFVVGSNGPEIVPPLHMGILSMTYKDRYNADTQTFDSYPHWLSDDLEAATEESNQIERTLEAEVLPFYELLYRCASENKPEGRELKDFNHSNLILRLDRDVPDPQYGEIHRPPVSEFYSEMLNQSEGESISLNLSDGPDPFDNKGMAVTVLGMHPSDEECLLVYARPRDLKRLKDRKMWCHIRDYGASSLVRRKDLTLKTALKRRHLLRWLEQAKSSDGDIERKALPGQILTSEGMFCVQGPPGTGKTHLACEVIAQLLERDPEARILVCAKEHQALATLREKLLSEYKPASVMQVTVSEKPEKHNGQNTVSTPYGLALDAIQKVTADSPSSWKEAAKSWKRQAPVYLEKLFETSAQLVFATTTSWPMRAARFRPSAEPFDFVVIEEAGKCYPSELFSPLAMSRRALLIGDQRQLPPFQIEATESALGHIKKVRDERGELVQSEANELEKGSWAEIGKWLRPFSAFYDRVPSYVLRDQYRMVPVISNLIGNTFYSKRFNNKRSEADSLPVFSHPLAGDMTLVWIDVPYCIGYPKAREDLSGHRYNKMELAIIAKLLRETSYSGAGCPSIAILSPYNGQVDRLAGKKGLKAALPSNCPAIPHFEPRTAVHTVDSFQGNEADLVILSLVRNNPLGNPFNAWGFVLIPERLNVMFSRARRHLVVVGCAEMVDRYSSYDQVKPLADVLDYFRKEGRIVDGRDVGAMV